jgi:hydroxymethylbilane synthase
LRIGIRRSAMALHQAGLVADALDRVGLTQGYVIVPIGHVSTGGDPSSFAGGPLQTAALRQGLNDDQCDIAVHLAKDIPQGSIVRIGAVLPRLDPADVLCSVERTRFEDLPSGARLGVPVGVRRAQLLGLRPDLTIVIIRGPIEARLELVASGQLDGIVVARSALFEPSQEQWIAQEFAPGQVVPGPGQGITVVEVSPRTDPAVRRLLEAISDADALIELVAERRLQSVMADVSHAPLGALATVTRDGGGRRLGLQAVVCGLNDVIRADQSVELSGDRQQQADQAKTLAQSLADRMTEQAKQVSETDRADRAQRPRVMYDSSTVPVEVYRAQIMVDGGEPVPVPMATTTLASDEELAPVVAEIGRSQCVGFASPLVVQVLAGYALRHSTTLEEMLAGVSVGAIGSLTASALAQEYVSFEVVPTASVSADSLASVWHRAPKGGAKPVTVIPCSSNSSPVLGQLLRDLGWEVHEPVVYTRSPAECGPAQQAAMADGWPDVVILSSRTSVEGFEALYGLPPSQVRVVVAGRYAAQDAIDLGLRVDVLVPGARVGEVVHAALDGLVGA